MAGPFDTFNDMEFQHWIPQLLRQSKNLPTVTRVLSARSAVGTNAWFAARDARGELDGYLADVQGAWRLADDLPLGPAPVGLQCICALILASVAELAGQIPPALSECFMHARVWTRDQAIAYARANPNAEAALEAISNVVEVMDGMGGDPGTAANRESLLALALATGRRRMTERKTMLFAKMASGGAPHEAAALLDGLAYEENEGTRLGGFHEIIPSLPPDLLARAASIARDFRTPSMKAEALATVAGRMGEDQQPLVIEEVLEVARSVIATDRSNGTRLLETLVGAVPDAYVEAVVNIAGQGKVSEDLVQHLTAAFLRRLATSDPEWASAEAEYLSGVQRDSVLTAAAVSAAHRGGWEAALEIISRIADDRNMRADALIAILPVLPAVDDDRFLREVSRLNAALMREVLRKIVTATPLSGRAARALYGIVESLRDEQDRFEACAVIAPVLGVDHVSDMLAQILADARYVTDSALADLAPGLTLAQTRQAFDWLALGHAIFGSEIATALGLRLVHLGHPEEAISRLADTRLHFERASALAALASKVPEHLVPAIRAACQPPPVAEKRMAARLALLPHLRSDDARQLASEIIADAASIPSRSWQLEALSHLVRDGISDAQTPLTEAIQDTCATGRGVNVDNDVVDALRAAGPAAVWTPDLLTALSTLKPSKRLSALLIVAATAGIAATQAAQAAVNLVVTEPEALNDADWDWDESVSSAAVASAVLAVDDDEDFCRAASALVSFIGPDELPRVVHRAQDIRVTRARLLLLASLSLALQMQDEPSGEHEISPAGIAATEDLHSDEWIHDETLLPAGLVVLGPVPALRGRVLERLSKLARTATDHETVLDLVLDISGVLNDKTPADLVTRGIDAVVELETSIAWWKVTQLAQFASEADIERLLYALRDSERLPCRSDVAAYVAAAIARRAVDLETDHLVRDSLRSINSSAMNLIEAADALGTLPDDVLPIADQVACDDQAYGSLVVAAAQRGDALLAMANLGNISSSWVGKNTRQDALQHAAARAAPEISIDLVEPVSGLPPALRAEPLASLAVKAPAATRTAIIGRAMRATSELGGRGASERRRVMDIVGDRLTKGTAAALAGLWKDAVRASSAKGRDDVLIDIAVFARPLIVQFGPDMANALGNAIAVAGADSWP